jgi:hypothetical protein
VLLPAQDLKAILAEVRSLRTEFEEYRAHAAEIAGESQLSKSAKSSLRRRTEAKY